jgi:Cu-processing system ATP-binding protein
MSDAATVRLDAVAKHYGAVQAVDEVELTLYPGQCVALVGHNGAGKSTLIKLMLGLVRPTAGRVEVLGADAAGHAFGRLRSAIGFLPENVVFPPAMTGAEVLAFHARLKRRPVRRNVALLERIGFADAAGRRAGTYSKGMRQRLGLAQALIGAPRLLLLDEPTSGLDPALRQDFYDCRRLPPALEQAEFKPDRHSMSRHRRARLPPRWALAHLDWETMHNVVRAVRPRYDGTHVTFRGRINDGV